jgi:hypothetical protein
MPTEGGYDRFTPGQRAVPVRMLNDPLRDLEAILRSAFSGIDVDKDPAGWRWVAHGPRIRPMHTTSAITAWSPATGAYGTGYAIEATTDTAAGTIVYNGEERTIYNEGPDAVPADRVILVYERAGATWVLSMWCASALP